MLKPTVENATNNSDPKRLANCGAKDCPWLGVADSIKKPQLTTVNTHKTLLIALLLFHIHDYIGVSSVRYLCCIRNYFNHAHCVISKHL